ncbi:MAG: hypothetical protein AB1554_01465 [Chloroflexota bacterium]
MSKRRDPFESSKPAFTAPVPPSIYDTLRVATPRKRNRKWEREHQHEKAVYRGVDTKLALRVKSIARDLSVPEGEVARALVEYALSAYGRGELDLNPRLNPERMRMTLFPSSHSRDEGGEYPGQRKRRKAPALWKKIITWRSFPSELKQEIAEIASEDNLNVPVGEVVTALLRFGLRAYESGILKLKPTAKSVSFTLVGRCEK